MTYHAPTVNAAGMFAWIGGTVTSLATSLVAVGDPVPGAGPTGGQVVATGGVTVAVIGLLVQVINKVFDDRKQERDERRAIREHEADLAMLKEKLEQANKQVEAGKLDLAESREKRHKEATEWNLRFLELQVQVRQNTNALNVNGPTIRNAADRLGLLNMPVAGEVPHVVPEPPVMPTLKLEPHAQQEPADAQP